MTPEKCAAAGVDYADKSELFRNSDFVSLHMQLSDRTRHMIDEPELALMKRSAFLINTARGGLVSEKALINALSREAIAGAAVDVYDDEPIPLDHPLRSLPNVLLTPHIGFVTEDNYRTYYGGTVEGIRAWLKNSPIRVLSPMEVG